MVLVREATGSDSVTLARLYSTHTAHTLCIYLNRLLGQDAFLRVKRLAFPI